MTSCLKRASSSRGVRLLTNLRGEESACSDGKGNTLPLS